MSLLLIVGCVGVPLFGGGLIVWLIRHNRQSRQAAGRLAAAMGLRALHPGTHPMQAWYDGSEAGYAFAIKPVVTLSSSSDGSGRSYSAEFWLRVVVALHEPHPGIAIARSSRTNTRAEAFETAFRQQDGAFALTPDAQRAMLAFVQQGFPTGIQGMAFRFKPGTRSLHLYDRAHCPPEIVPPDVLPDAPAVLVHDMLNAAGVTPEKLHSTLHDLLIVAHAIEG